jgi:hypothetical protein
MMTDLQLNRPHSEVIRLFDGEDQGVAGEAANLVVTALQDGVVSSLSFTVTEVDSTDPDVIGSYLVSWTPNTLGDLYVRVSHATYNILGWDENYRVLRQLQDQSGFGDRTITITVKDADTGVGIQGVNVSIYNPALSYRYAAGTTNASGVVNLSVSDGTYSVILSKIGAYDFSTETLVVTADKSVTYTGDAFSPSAPSAPGLCVVYGWEYDPSSEGISSVKVKAQVMADNRFLSSNPHVIRSKEVTSAASSGYWEMALTRSDQYVTSGATYKFTIDGKKQGDYAIPARSSIAFKDLIAL